MLSDMGIGPSAILIIKSPRSVCAETALVHFGNRRLLVCVGFVKSRLICKQTRNVVGTCLGYSSTMSAEVIFTNYMYLSATRDSEE
jgi:hypothetical protein